MLVKFNKGPKHGKTMAVPDFDREISIAYIKAGGEVNYRDLSPQAATFNTGVARYKMKFMSHPKWGTYPCTDPDGRVYFEYVP